MNNRQIYRQLKKNPDFAYITPDGKALYAAPYRGKMVKVTGPNFKEMTEDEINEWILTHVK